MRKIHVNKHGAFKLHDRKPGEMTKGGAMPDIFKFERLQENALTEPYLIITNEKQTWKTQWPISRAPKELVELMADRSKIYMICIPGPQALQPLQMISDQNW